jgi:hypothetical protein
MNHIRKLAGATSKPKRREPTPADYCDEVSDATIEEIKRVAASKDDEDEKWEVINGPAW